MNNFAALFKRYRLKAEFISLSAFADAFSQKGYFYELSLYCHWQKGRRIPAKRVVLICLIELFIQRGAITSLNEANDFLESAEHGYLTKKEQQILFPENLRTSQTSV
jgi:hypothetical protein